MRLNVERSVSRLSNQNETIAQIIKMLEEIKFGSIEIVIHDSKITQIERREKLRPLAEK